MRGDSHDVFIHDAERRYGDHALRKEDCRVKVYIETPDEKDGFHSAVCWLPGYQWEKVRGYTESEMDYFKRLMRNNAHLILEFSQDGGILNATTA